MSSDVNQEPERHRRSITREEIIRAERTRRGPHRDAGETLARVRQIRERASQVYVTDEDLRAARDEGRR
jgi:hypothetical protein